MRSSLALAIVLALTAAGCAGGGGEEELLDPGGKADSVDPALAALARAYAEAFDFEGESSTEVPREEAATTGPTWVQRAFQLHHSWEERDLGSARLYRWTVERYRVWAIRTSTDGDDSFIELFDANGGFLASGVGGFEPDPDGGFHPIITWDDTPGAERDRIAPMDISGDVTRFWSELADSQAADSPSGATTSTMEARALAEVLLAGPATTDTLDGWEQATVWRALADQGIAFAGTGRTALASQTRFYQNHVQPLGTVTAAQMSTLGLPSSMSTRVKAARAAVTGDVAVTGQSELIRVAARLGVMPTGEAPASATALRSAAIRVGCTDTQATALLHAIGADTSGARIFVGSAFTTGSDFFPVLQPGSLWFVASSATGRVWAVRLIPSGETVAGWDAKAEAAIAGATGVTRDARLVQLRPRDGGTYLDLEYARPDGGVLAIALWLTTSGQAVAAIRAFSPGLDPELRQNLADTIQSKLGGPAVDVVGAVATATDSRYLALYRAGTAASTPVRLARVDFASSTVTRLTLQSDTSPVPTAELAALALSAARHRAETLVADAGAGDMALLEVLLRTAWTTPDDLDRITDPADSPVGFDPATEVAQFMLGSVWGDTAVVVTYARAGTVRVEDVN